MNKFRCGYILCFLFFLTSCGSEISVETFTDAKEKIKTTLKSTNTLEQSTLENIGNCNFQEQNDPAYQDPLEFKIHFSDKIDPSTFSSANINNIGTGGGTSITWNIINCGDKNNFLLRATSVVGDGSIIPVVDVIGIKYTDGTNSKGFGSTDNSVTYTKPSAFTWMGYTDNNWSDNTNWYGGVKPGIADIAIFNNACSRYSCTVNINELVSIDGIDIGVDFSGSVTQAAGQNLNLGESGFNQNGGFYIVGANIFSTDGDFKVNSGTFNSAGSLVRFSGSLNGLAKEINSPTTNLNNVEFTFGTTNGTVKQINIINSLKITGNLTMNTNGNSGGDRIDGGELVVEGDITILNWDSHSSTIAMRISGGDNQTITGATGESFASIIIDKSGGVATFAGPVIEIKGDFTHLNGLVDFGTVKTNFNYVLNSTITPGSVNFYDVDFTFGQAVFVNTKTIVGTMKVLNDLTFNTDIDAHLDRIDGGAIDVKGDINIIHSDIGTGATNIILSGTTDQTINQIDGDLPGNIVINKPSGSVILGTNFISTRTGQDFQIQAGNINMAGFDLTINNNLTLETLPAQTNLYTNCGTLNVGGVTTDIGSGIIASSGIPSINISDAITTEGGKLNFVVTLSEGICGGNFTVVHTVSDGTATLGDLDYTDNDNTLTITPGNLSGTITVATTGDTTLEVDETLSITLSANSHGTIVDGIGTGTLVNDQSGGFQWTGLGADDNWSTGENWSGGVSPGVSDTPYFSDVCTNCNSNIDSSVSVRGIFLQSTYSGTLSQGTGNSFTIGSSHWEQDGGNFIGGNSAINLNGNFKQSGGSFTSTSGTFGIGYNYPGSNPDGLRITGGTFLHNNGTMDWKWGHSGASWSVRSGYININSTLSLNNLIISASGHSDRRGTIQINSSDTIIVEGNLTLSASGAAIQAGTIEVKGNVSGQVQDGTSRIKLTGSTNQTIANNTRIPGNLEFASTGGVVTASGNVYLSKGVKYTSGVLDISSSHFRVDQNWRSSGGGCGGWCAEFDTDGMIFNDVTISLGTTGDDSKIHVLSDFHIDGNLTYSNASGSYQRMNGGNIYLKGDLLMTTQRTTGGSTTINLVGSTNQSITNSSPYTYSTNSDSYFPSINIASTGGIVKFNGTIPISTNFTYTSGTVDLSGTHFIFGEPQFGEVYSASINAAALTFNNVTFRKRLLNLTIVGGLNVDGNLIYRHSTSNNTRVDGAAINLAGNLTYNQASLGGNAPINFEGTMDQTINYSSGTIPSGNFTVNKASGKVLQASNLSLPGGAQNLSITDGDWDMAGFDLTIANDLAIANTPAQSYLYTNCGTLTVGGTTSDLGSGIITSGSNPNISISDESTTEGGTLNFVVSLSEAVCGGNFTVNHNVNNYTASTGDLDYTDNDNTLTLLPGQTTGSISVSTTSDSKIEADEEVRVVLNTASHGVLVDAEAIGIIVNDDVGSFLWTGVAGDDQWSNTANWSGGVVPGNSDIAIFDSTCASCNIDLDTNVDVQGFILNSGYNGTITQNPGVTMAIGAGNFIQYGGVFVGGDSAITLIDDILITGGVFTSTSSDLNITNDIKFLGGTQNFPVGRVHFIDGAESSDLTLNGASFNDLRFDKNSDHIYGDDFTVNGDLFISNANYSTINNTITVLGDIAIDAGAQNSSGKLIVAGAGTQTITGIGGFLPFLEIKSTGIVNLVGSVSTVRLSYISGTVNAGTSTVYLRASSAVLNSGTMRFWNLNLQPSYAGAAWISGTVLVDNNLTIDEYSGAGTINNGEIEVSGNLNIIELTDGGTTNIKMVGSNVQTITQGAGDDIPGTLYINKTGGEVTQSTDVNLSLAGQNMEIIAGNYKMAGKNLTINNNLTIANVPSQSYLHKDCGTLTVGGTTTDPGSGITTTGQNPSISINDPSSNEGDSVDYIVTLSEAVCGSAVTVDYASSNGTATLIDLDYTQTSGTLSLPIGTTSGVINLPTTSDVYAEANETVNMNLSNSSHGTVADAIGTGTILNDDGSVPLAIYRSTGFGNTTALSLGTDNSGTDLTISGSIATFENSQPDDIGLGDAIQYDNSGDTVVDKIIFISGRISSTQFNVQNIDGTAVTDLVAADTDWSIFRAYTSLANAENGTENTGIDGTLQDFDTWSGGKDLVASGQVWNIITYADAVDTAPVLIDGWDTDKNTSIKIYSPSKSTEVGKSQRHIGIWNIGGYILDPGVTTVSTFSINEDYVHIDGLQVKGSDTTGVGKAVTLVSGSGKLIKFSNSIIRGPEGSTGTTTGVLIDSTIGSNQFWFYNNIIYGFDGALGYGLQVNGATPGYVYNNTFSNNVNSITVQTTNTNVSFKNNLVRNSITSSFAGSAGFHASSDYNISGDGDMPGANSITSSAVVFRSKSSDESRLDSIDTIAKNAGIDISGESILLSDLMGHPRGTDGSWDIGAHEAATKMYRSIASGNTTTLESGTGNNLGISSGIVTFSTGIASNIGIGDAIQYDRSGDGSIDSLMFIYGRTNSTTFIVKDKNGEVPADLGADDDWDIFRAYTSLSNASNLLENTGLDVAIRNFTDNTDLVSQNIEKIYSLYSDAAFPVMGTIFDSNWNKSATSNIRLYVPYTLSEVGTSQRHTGAWNTSYVHFTDSATLLRPSSFMEVDGIQLFLNNNTASGYQYGIRSSSSYTLKNSIVRGPDSNTATSTVSGIYNGDLSALGTKQVFVNNVFYNWKNNSTSSAGIRTWSSNIDVVAYNNTFVDNERAISAAHAGVILKNNISQDLVLGFSGTYHPDSSNNLSFDTNSPGAGSMTNSTLSFVNKAADDFNLAVGDTDPQASGADLTNDGYFSFDSDIQKQSRPTADWDMGAFQY